jgi:hypothetical protein
VLIIGVTIVLNAYFTQYDMSYYEMKINKKFRELKEDLEEHIKEELNNDKAIHK